MRDRDRRALLAAAVLGPVCGIVLGSAAAPGILTVPAGIALLLVLPGFGLQLALFPGPRLDRTERVVMSLGLSLCLAIVGGFLLNWSTSGLTAPSWGLLLGGVTALFAGVAWLRLSASAAGRAATAAAAGSGTSDEPLAKPVEAPGPPGPSFAGLDAQGARRPIPMFQLAMLGAAVVFVLAALGVARFGLAEQPRPGYTELWLMEESSATAVRVGFANHEGATTTYHLTVTVDGQPLRQLTVPALANGEAWEQVLDVPQASIGSSTGPAGVPEVAAALFRETDQVPYREARVSLLPAPTPKPTATPKPRPSKAPVATPSASGAVAGSGSPAPSGRPGRTPAPDRTSAP
ncbi:MAG: hypothetical protein QOH61_2857 [Chloroflexota bacterium]|nr:hypothetical protein [Chloroflexota bacterium]